MDEANGKKTGASGSEGGSTWDRLHRFLKRDVWAADLGGIPTFRAFLYRGARVLYLAVRGLVKNDCLNQAAAMTYVTVLSLVPLMALAFSVAKGFGFYDNLVANTIMPALDNAFGIEPESGASPAPAEEPAGENGAPGADAAVSPVRDAIERLLSFVSRTSFSNLGILGLGFLLFTAIKLLTSMENAFNRIWGVKKSRTYVRRTADYLALVVVTPVVLMIATAATGAAQSNAVVDYLSEELHLETLLSFAFRLVPLLVLWVGFGFVYMTMPNTRVNAVSALVGGVFGGTLWQVFQVLHVEFQVGVARYNAIYAGFAAIPVFLVWVYAGWVAVLLGAQFAWAHQAEPEHRDLMRESETKVADLESLAVHAMVAVARAFRGGEGAVSTVALAARFAVPPRLIADALGPLVDGGLLIQADSAAGGGFVPGTSLDRIRIQAVLDAVRGRGGEVAASGEVGKLLDRFHAEIESLPANRTMDEMSAGGL